MSRPRERPKLVNNNVDSIKFSNSIEKILYLIISPKTKEDMTTAMELKSINNLKRR